MIVQNKRKKNDVSRMVDDLLLDTHERLTRREKEKNFRRPMKLLSTVILFILI